MGLYRKWNPSLAASPAVASSLGCTSLEEFVQYHDENIWHPSHVWKYIAKYGLW